MENEADWFKAAREEFQTFFDLEQSISKDEALKRKTRFFDTYHGLFLSLVRELGIRDDWDDGHCHMFPFSTGIIERSSKLNLEITIGVSMDTWFIEAAIQAPYYLRYMKDNYWAHIVRLSNLGKAELQDYGRPANWLPTEEARALVKPKCSLVFSIARDYTLMAAGSDDGFSLGGINISMPFESKQDKVEEFYRLGIESLYKSNQMLVSVANAQQKRNLKKFSNQGVRDGT